MRLLALSIDSVGTINNPSGFNNNTFVNLGSAVSAFLSLGIVIAGVLMLFWGFWGVFQYIFAGGKKETLANARKRIIFSIVGFILVALAFLIQRFVAQIYPINSLLNVTPVRPPQ